jgi:hypothetical protein
MDVSETLRGLEASLLTNAVRKNRARVAELLAEDFREFGRSGTAYTKAEILQFLPGRGRNPCRDGGLCLPTGS